MREFRSSILQIQMMKMKVGETLAIVQPDRLLVFKLVEDSKRPALNGLKLNYVWEDKDVEK